MVQKSIGISGPAMFGIIAGVISILAILGLMTGTISLPQQSAVAEQQTQTIQAIVQGSNTIEEGTAATLYFDVYDSEASAQTEIYPEYYIYTNGILKVNGAVANDTTCAVGDTVDLYGSSEDGTYYVTPKLGVAVDSASKSIEMVGATMVTESNLAITGYDDTMAALTSDDNDNNTADYNLGDIGADETVEINLKFKNGQANAVYQLGAICVGYGGDVDDAILTSSGWSEGALPKELDDATINQTNDSASTFTVDWKRCYVPDAGQIDFHEWQYDTFSFQLSADATGADANTGDVVVVGFMDMGYEKGKDGQMYKDFYVHDDNEEVTDVGISEDYISTAAFGLKATAQIELQ